jgi:hypothetical protein
VIGLIERAAREHHRQQALRLDGSRIES